ncbi:hypothetical protein SKC37_02865 [Aquirufa sp. HETE-83D]|uniref:Uncharacterized protein n=1 Tax=Aquirufa esocilacus TaxID=3096513 RepID=A0ABW6DJ93_9BACT
MKNFNKIAGIVLISLFTLFSADVCQAQTLGTKKVVTFKLQSYACGSDVCEIEFKDISSGKIYTFENIDKKSKYDAVMDEILESYENNDESDSKIIGKTYKAILEFRKTEVLSYDGDIPKRTGKQKSQWMINSIFK